MKRVFIPLILSLSLLASPAADAASRDHDHRHERKERERFERKVNHDRKKEFKKRNEHRYDRPDKHEHKRSTPLKFHTRRTPPPPPPGLAPMIYHRYPGARHMRVWAVSPGVYMLRYLLGGIWYMQEVYPARHAYGRRMRVYDRGDYWYSNDGYRYYDRGEDLLYNGSVMPAIQLNINL